MLSPLSSDDFHFFPGGVSTLEILREGPGSGGRVANILSAFDPLLTLRQSRWGKLGFVAVYRGADASALIRDFASIDFQGFNTGVPVGPVVAEDEILAPVGSGWLRISGEAAEAIIEAGGEVKSNDVYFDVEAPDEDYFRITLGDGHVYFVGEVGRVLLDLAEGL